MSNPAPKIYVDCDDTLIKWVWDKDENGMFLTVDHAEYNTSLIDAINAYRALNRTHHLIVWSGGGADYAMRWAERCFPDNRWGYMPKDIGFPTERDICVDDQILKVNSPLYTPEEFINYMRVVMEPEPTEKECNA